MAPTVAGVMGLVPIHALGVELGVLFAQMLIQLRLGSEPQFALRALKRAHRLMVLRLANHHRLAPLSAMKILKDP
jgi:hypothetical protein